jgi:D-xylose transport system substrate-binding protein
MRKGMLALAAVGVLAVGSAAACGGNDNGGGSGSNSGGGSSTGKVGVILPDTKSSARWATDDIKYLKQAFDAAGVQADIQNAQGDKTQFQTIADGMISSGVKVLMIVNLDSGTGKAVLDKAKNAGIATIDYDRLTLNGGANYYVSFDNVKVGELQGQGLVQCLTDKKYTKPKVAELNGSPTDNNATLFAQGYDSVLKPKYADGTYVKGPNQSVPDWDNAQAGTIFEQMLTANKDIKGVLAANDGLGNAVISVLKKNKLNGQVPVTGQDATLQGLQHILVGDQCMSVYKAIKKEADAASQLAIALAKGQKPTTATGTVKDPESGKDVPSVLLTPQAITKTNVKDVVADGFVSKDQLCAGSYAKPCADAGIS